MKSAWGLEIERDVNWRQFAACGPDTAELFHVTSHLGKSTDGLTKQRRAALAICADCPVRQPCHDDARDHPQLEGWHIAGGVVWPPTTRRHRYRSPQ